jgi:hypothetical protein
VLHLVAQSFYVNDQRRWNHVGRDQCV